MVLRAVDIALGYWIKIKQRIFLYLRRACVELNLTSGFHLFHVAIRGGGIISQYPQETLSCRTLKFRRRIQCYLRKVTSLMSVLLSERSWLWRCLVRSTTRDRKRWLFAVSRI